METADTTVAGMEMTRAQGEATTSRVMPRYRASWRDQPRKSHGIRMATADPKMTAAA